jgi:hypothetical protein
MHEGWIAAIVTGLGGLVTICVTAYLSFRKGRVEVRQGEQALTRDQQDEERKDQDNAIRQWREYAKAREAQHKQDMEAVNLQLKAHRQEINDLRKLEGDCRVLAARQEVTLQNQDATIKGQQKEIDELKRAVKTLQGGGDGNDQ